MATTRFNSVHVLSNNEMQICCPVTCTGDFIMRYLTHDKSSLPRMLHQHDKAEQVECENARVECSWGDDPILFKGISKQPFAVRRRSHTHKLLEWYESLALWSAVKESLAGGVQHRYTRAFAAMLEEEGGASNTNQCHMFLLKPLYCVQSQQLNCVFILHLRSGGRQQQGGG